MFASEQLDKIFQRAKSEAEGLQNDLTIPRAGRLKLAEQAVEKWRGLFQDTVTELKEKTESTKQGLYNAWANESPSPGLTSSLELVKALPDFKIYEAIQSSPEVRAALIHADQVNLLSGEYQRTLLAAFRDTHRNELQGIERQKDELDWQVKQFDNEIADGLRPKTERDLAIQAFVDRTVAN